MKTFDEKDLITWSNRDKAVIGKEYYFADCLDAIKRHIEKGNTGKLKSIADSSIVYTFEDNILCHYSCILPVDAVKEIKLEKKYRACRNVQELCELVFNCKRATKDSFCINGLIGTVIHFRQKGFDTTLYECITGIAVYNNGDIAVHIGGCNFELDELFKNYKIEINGKWQPFGVEE